MAQQQQVINIPLMLPFAGVWLPPQGILSVDERDYQAGKAERLIVVKLAGPHELELDGESADAFKLWWDQVTGQNRIQPAPVGLHIAKH